MVDVSFGQCNSVCDKLSLAAVQEPHFQLFIPQ